MNNDSSLTISNKPKIEILANMYFEMIKYLEIELLLTDELFNNNKDQFTKIIADSLTLVLSYPILLFSLSPIWKTLWTV